MDHEPEVTGSAEPFVPHSHSLARLREAAKGCHGCPLYLRGTQTVFGAGRKGARVMFVGEQPGNEEDKAGEPFVGPAGRLLDKLLEEAGIDRKDAYVTNAVKHFKWEPSGKRRIHKKPGSREISACLPWLEAEIATVKPQVIVALGATAAQALLGKSFKVTKDRGRLFPSRFGPMVLATTHPSSVLRAPDSKTRHEESQRIVDDLRVVSRSLDQETSPEEGAGEGRTLH